MQIFASAGRKVGQEVVGVGEVRKRRVTRHVTGREHVQALQAGLVGHRGHQFVGVAVVRIEPPSASASWRSEQARVGIVLDRERSGALLGQVHRRGVVAVHREGVRSGAQEFARDGRQLVTDERVDVGVELADVADPIARRGRRRRSWHGRRSRRRRSDRLRRP